MTEQKVIPLRARRAPVSENPAPAKAAPKRRTKVKAKPKRENWTAEMKRTFLANLAATANVQASIRAIGMSESAVYRLRQRSPEFRADWMAALREGYARLELMVLERAMNGTQKPIMHAGQIIGQVTEYSDRLALTLLTAHREAVMGEGAAKKVSASEPEEVRRRILDKLAEMNARLGAIACWTSGGWRFVASIDGMVAWSITDEVWLQWNGAEWVAGLLIGHAVRIGGLQVVGARRAAIANPAGGANIDAEARGAIAGILDTLRGHGLIAA
jgi:hypothetical protein